MLILRFYAEKTTQHTDHQGGALKILNIFEDIPSVGLAHYNLGEANLRFGELDPALEHFRGEATKFEPVRALPGVADALLGCGEVSGAQGDTARSRDFYMQADIIRGQRVAHFAFLHQEWFAQDLIGLSGGPAKGGSRYLSRHLFFVWRSAEEGPWWRSKTPVNAS